MLIGKNLSLRPATVEDAQLLADWSSDPDFLGQFFNIWPMIRQRMERRLAEREKQDLVEGGQFIICNLDMTNQMGTIGYFNPFALKEFFKGLEVFYQVHPDFRGHGIATQAACLLVNHLFDATPVERIQATVVVGNEGSGRVLEKAGMQKDGIYRRVFFLHGRYVDLHLYSIVRSDWKDEKSYRQARPEF
jgi:ribosomal-protein-alanine N-acetyltransferase